MSQGITKTAPLQDIPLAVEEQNPMISGAQNMTKTGTIRRLFKLPYKKSEISTDTKSESDALKTDDKNFEEPRRFHLRLGNKQKKNDASADNLDELPTSSAQNIPERLTMKKSIFKYWQTIFKNVKSSNSSPRIGHAESNEVLPTSPDTNNIEPIQIADVDTTVENNSQENYLKESVSEKISASETLPIDDLPNEVDTPKTPH